MYCSNRCSALATSRRIRADDDPRARRYDRASSAPGLTPYAVNKLGKRWAKQGRRCTYCDQPATTVDHVLPLVRGGTSYEGNLTPCCKACNSRKSALTVMEWRTGRRLPPMNQTLDAMGRRKPKREPKPDRWATQPLFRLCPECGDAYSRDASHCTQRCYARAYYRTRYRRQVGIPDTAPKWTRAA